jgi:hypothetical protein
MDELRENVVKYLGKTYHCGWNNTIRDNETNEVIEVDFIITLLIDSFSIKINIAETYLIYFLIETTLDVQSVVTFWTNNRDKDTNTNKRRFKSSPYDNENLPF